MIRDLIRREFGVALSEVSVGRLLQMMGLSPQRPLHRAYEQDPDAVQRWKSQEFCGSPEIVEGFLCRFRLGLGFPDLVVDGR